MNTKLISYHPEKHTFSSIIRGSLSEPKQNGSAEEPVQEIHES